jgi:hypothetical protein
MEKGEAMCCETKVLAMSPEGYSRTKMAAV